MSPISPPKYVVVVVALFLFNLATAGWYPRVWIDEVMFADPAANLYQGRGFVSTAWPVQEAHELFSGNAPLYSLLLSRWYRLFGFGMVQTRSLGLALWCCATLLTCAAAKRLGIVKGSKGLALLALLAMTGGTVAVSYRTGRNDSLMFLSVAGCFYGFSMRQAFFRYCALFVSSALFAFSGMVLVFYAVSMGALLSLFALRSCWKNIVAVGMGTVFGVAALYASLSVYGTLDRFVKTATSLKALIRPADAARQLFYFANLRHLPEVILQDKCAVAVLMTLGLIAVLRWKLWNALQRRVVVFCLVTAFAIPIVIQVVYAFCFYYCWLTYIPLCVGLVVALELDGPRTFRGAPYVLGAVVLVFVFCGLPKYLAIGFLDGEDRDYEQIDSVVKNGVSRSDIVFSDFQGFYALHQRDCHGLYGYYLERMTPAEKAAVNCLVINPKDIEHYERTMGGKWEEVGEGYIHRPRVPLPHFVESRIRHMEDISNTKFELAVFRRVDEEAK